MMQKVKQDKWTKLTQNAPTVADLIESLENLDPTTPVVIGAYDSRGGGYNLNRCKQEWADDYARDCLEDFGVYEQNREDYSEKEAFVLEGYRVVG